MSADACPDGALTTPSYLSQILYGCKSAHCDTPTCLSSHQRNASRPYRPTTQLTASTLAHYLASQDNPNRGLCPNELRVAPASFEIDESLVQHENDGAGAGEDYVVYPSVSQRLAEQYRYARIGSGDGDGASVQQHDLNADIANALRERQQARKDPKALGQNLYDSFAIIYNYTKKIPSPASVLASLRTNYDASSTEPSAVPALRTIADPVPNGHSDAARDRNPPRSHSQLQRTEDQDSHTGKSAAEILSNGQQVHKIPYHPPRSAKSRQHSLATDTSTLDGSADTAMLSITKSGRKSFTIGATSPHVNGLPKPSPAARQESTQAHQTTHGVPIIANLNCNLLDRFKEETGLGDGLSTDSNYVVDYDSRRHLQLYQKDP